VKKCISLVVILQWPFTPLSCSETSLAGVHFTHRHLPNPPPLTMSNSTAPLNNNFGGAILMEFHSMTPSRLFNFGTTFSQTVTGKFSLQHFRI